MNKLPETDLAILIRAFNRNIKTARALKKTLKEIGYISYAAGVGQHIRELQGTIADIREQETTKP